MHANLAVEMPEPNNDGEDFVSGSIVFLYIGIALWNLSTWSDPDELTLSISMIDQLGSAVGMCVRHRSESVSDSPRVQKVLSLARHELWSSIRCQFLWGAKGHKCFTQLFHQTFCTTFWFVHHGPVWVSVYNHNIILAVVSEIVTAHHLKRVTWKCDLRWRQYGVWFWRPVTVSTLVSYPGNIKADVGPMYWIHSLCTHSAWWTMSHACANCVDCIQGDCCSSNCGTVLGCVSVHLLLA